MNPSLEDVRTQINALLRPASIAEIGGFRPPDRIPSSTFGGNFACLPDEKWPVYRKRNMCPLIQVRVDELPFVPKALRRIALFTVFVDRRLPSSGASNGDGWLIRLYDSLADLRPCSNQSSHHVKSFPIKWSLEEVDAPAWEDLWQLTSRVDPSGIEPLLDFYHDTYKTQTRTKIGGWPSYIQSAIEDEGTYVFQVDSEPKANWFWGDSGAAYFYMDHANNWRLYWQCL
jgi:hypothetical protein